MGFSLTLGMNYSPILKLSWMCPFRRTRLLDFDCLNSILALLCKKILHRSLRIHRPSGTDLAVIGRSSMNALIGACWQLLARTVPLLIISTVLTKRFIAAAREITKTAYPVMIPFSNRCQLVVKSPQVNHILKHLKYSCRMR